MRPFAIQCFWRVVCSDFDRLASPSLDMTIDVVLPIESCRGALAVIEMRPPDVRICVCVCARLPSLPVVCFQGWLGHRLRAQNVRLRRQDWCEPQEGRALHGQEAARFLRLRLLHGQVHEVQREVREQVLQW